MVGSTPNPDLVYYPKQDNEAEPSGVCAIGTDFVSVVETPHPGWEWVDEGRGEEHKWGFVSNTVSMLLA